MQGMWLVGAAAQRQQPTIAGRITPASAVWTGTAAMARTLIRLDRMTRVERRMMTPSE